MTRSVKLLTPPIMDRFIEAHNLRRMNEGVILEASTERKGAVVQIHPRIAGVLYIFYFLSATPLALRSSLIRLSDPAATAAHIFASEHIYRLSIVSDLASYAAYIALTILLAQIGALVSRTWALVAALLSLAGCIVLLVSSTLLMIPLVVSSPAPGALSIPQLQQLSTIAFRLYAQGYNESLFLFGAFCAIMGSLFAVGRQIPLVLSILLALAGIAWIVASAANVTLPAIGSELGHYVFPLGAAAELLLGLWLLIRGVNLQHVMRDR